MIDVQVLKNQAWSRTSRQTLAITQLNMTTIAVVLLYAYHHVAAKPTMEMVDRTVEWL